MFILVYCFSIIAIQTYNFDNQALQRTTEPKLEELITINIKRGIDLAEVNNDSAFYYFAQALETATALNDTSTIINTVRLEIKYLEIFGHYTEIANKIDLISQYQTQQTNYEQTVDFEKLKGRIYWKIKDFDKAQKTFETLKNIAIKNSDKEIEALSINNIGLVFSERGYLDSALSAHKHALIIYMNLRSNNGISSTYNLMGNAYLRLNRYDQAISNYYESNRYAVQSGDSIGIARSLSNMAKAQSRSGNTNEAISNLNKALAIWEKIGDAQQTAAIYNELGSTYKNINNYLQALENFQNALRIRRNMADMQQIAATLNNIGTIYKEINLTEAALDYYEEALSIHRQLSNDALISQSLNFMGGVYYKRAQYDHALDYYLSALGYSEIIGDKIENAKMLNNIALMYKNQGNFKASFEYYTQSLELYRQITDHKRTAEVINNIGNLYLTQKQYNEAKQQFIKALQIRGQIRDYRGIALSNSDLAKIEITNNNIYKAIEHLKLAWDENRVDLGYEMRCEISKQISELYEKIKDYKRALYFRHQYEAYNDSLINKELLQKLSEVKTQYETDKSNFLRGKEAEEQEIKIQLIIKERQQLESALLAENRLQQSIRNLVILLLLAVICILLLLLSRYRLKNRINSDVVTDSSKQNKNDRKQLKLSD